MDPTGAGSRDADAAAASPEIPSPSGEGEVASASEIGPAASAPARPTGPLEGEPLARPVPVEGESLAGRFQVLLARLRARLQPSNLQLRLLTTGMLLPPIVWACYYGGLPYLAVVIALSVLGVNEFYHLISAKGATPQRGLGTVAVAVLPIVVYLGDAFWATTLVTAVLLVSMILQLLGREIREAIASVSATFFGIFYVGWLLSHAVSVRFIQHDLVRRYGEGAAVDISPEVGFFYMIFCLSAAAGCDAGAYFVGRAYGRRALAPAISPNKTVEGALGGVLVGGFAAVLAKLLFDVAIPGELARDLTYPVAALFGLAIAAAGVLGDLVESLLKRDADLKDAGSLLPGIGGILDRADSALLAIPVTYYLLLLYYWVRLQP